MGFGSLFSKWKKVRDKYLRLWKQTIEKYGLGIPQDMYYHIAVALGKAEGGSFWSNFFSGGILGFLGAIVGVIITVFTYGVGGFFYYAGLAAAAVGMAAAVYGAYAQTQMQKMGAAYNGVRSHSEMLKAKGEVYSQGDKLTEYIVYTDYQIYANNSIYKQHAPGSQSYSPSIAFDPSKGMFANSKFSELDEHTQNRAHYTKAGNKGYMQERLDVPFRLAEGGLTIEQTQDALENNVRKNNRRIVDGFTVLAEQKMNFTGELQKIYEWVIEQQIHPFFKKMIKDDFLDKLKNYQRALRADFEFLWLKDFIDKKMSEEEREKKAKQSFKQSQRFRKYIESVVNDDAKMKAFFCENIGEQGYTYKFGQTQEIFVSSFPFEVKKQGERWSYVVFKVTNFETFLQALENGYQFWVFLFKGKRVLNNAELGKAIKEDRKQDQSGLILKSMKVSPQSFKDDFRLFKANYRARLEDETLEYEYKILNESDYIQKSRLYSQEEKALNFLEKLEAFLKDLVYAVDFKFYALQNELKDAVQSHIFTSLSKKTSKILSQKSSEFLAKDELEVLNFANSQEVFNFYLKITDFLGSLENKDFVFCYQNFIGFFKDAESFEMLKKPLYFDENLKSFDFNSVKMEWVFFDFDF